MKRKKLLELTMAAEVEEDSHVDLNSLIDTDDPFNSLVTEISKKMKKKNK